MAFLDGHGLQTFKTMLDGLFAKKANKTDIPTKVSQLTNDSGFTDSTGTVISVATGSGLTGGPVTTSGTIKVNVTEETRLANSAVDSVETAGRVYPVRLDVNGKLAVNVPWTDTSLVASVAGKTGAVVLEKEDVGLGNVENKSSASIRSEITSANVVSALGYTPLDSSLKGALSGLAELTPEGKVPASQLPSYVDDVLEFETEAAFPVTGETGKIYVAADTNLTYRWSGTGYVEISQSLALGETASTAYRGDRGKTAYDHATAKGSAFASGLYKITTNEEGHVTDATAVAKVDIVNLGIPESDTTYSDFGPATGDSAGNRGLVPAPSAGKQMSYLRGDGTWSMPTDTNTTYTLTQNAANGHILTFSPSEGNATTITIPDNNTTYTLSQDATDGHKFTLTGTDGTETTITIPDNNTTYSSKPATDEGSDVSLVTTGEKYTWNSKLNSNLGTTHAGKFLIVGSTGAITPVMMEQWAGGDY